ncbi:Alpha/Beta hydrolase protein [Aspergillus novoparasiticus]|uniref:Alpha/Beta hydrolase protein n=1 Tax=Aspergillus novoparasiticus TaxID=986946 RepID=A0A5N6ETT0_9EURO|nr:Alpha/Beta hydrolase protein [Aspergillus novoparasiticus]
MELANNGTYLGTPLFFAPTSGSGNSLNNVRPTLKKGSWADVPVMYGTNKNEGSIFAHVRRLNKAKEAEKRALPPQQVWRYRYSPEFPNLTPYDDAGAYHGAELPQVFGTYNATTATENQIALSAFMQKTWTDFAKDPENGPGWPSLNEDSKLADFGNDENPQGITLIEAKDADKNCGVWFRESEAYDLAW